MTTGSIDHGLTSCGSERRECRERRRIDDDGRDVESSLQLVGPLPSQTRRREDERALAPSAPLQLGQHQSGLDRLSEADFVGEQKTRRVSRDQRERRFELKRKDVDRRARRARGAVRTRGAPTATDWRCRIQRRGVTARTAASRVDRIGRSNGSSSLQARAVARLDPLGREAEHSAVGEGRRLVDNPSLSAHRDAVAGDKLHAAARGNASCRARIRRQCPALAGLCLQDRNSCPQMRVGIVKKFHHERMLLEQPAGRCRAGRRGRGRGSAAPRAGRPRAPR